MSRNRSRRIVVVFAVLMAIAATASACEDDQGPLVLRGAGGLVLDPIASGAWDPVGGCLRDGTGEDAGVDIMVTKAVATHVRGVDPKRVEVLVAWEGRGARSDVMGVPGRPSAAYQPVTAGAHSGGTLVNCSLSLAIALPGDAAKPASVGGLDVTYEVDGTSYTAHASVELALCPAGTRAASDDRLCR